MKIRSRALVIAVVLPLVAGVGCARLKARQAFKDGNKAYKEENYKKAVEYYQRVVDNEPTMPEAYFYLASSQQMTYRPGKDSPENKQRLEDAISNFKKSLELNQGVTPDQQTVRLNTLAALTSIYSEDPYRSYDEAYKYADLLVQQNPNDSKNLFAMANLFEKFDKVAEAEKMYERAAELNPNDTKACAALAGFYNKPLWDGRSKFDQAIQTLERCATLAPDDAQGWYKVSTFYWDKAYRDPLLSEKQKEEYADKGLAAVEKALQLKPDYFEAVTYKGLLLRVKALVATNPRTQAQFLEQAQVLQKRAQDLRLQAQREAEAAANTLGAAAPPAQ